MHRHHSLHSFFFAALLLIASAAAAPGDRAESFDRDPGWEGRNNRSTAFPVRQATQDFGYSPTSHAGGAPGEIGGRIQPAAEPAYYAKKISERTLDDPLTASGKLACPSERFHVLIGFFNSRTLAAWRGPDTLAIRLLGRGSRFFAFVEYATSKGRAGADNPGGFPTIPDPQTGRRTLVGFPAGKQVHTWSISYDPAANNGGGAVRVTLNGETSTCILDPGHKADGARFDRFGVMPVLKHWDDHGEIWLDDLTILGRSERFDRNPKWDERGNRRSYSTTDTRPRFDFGYSPTRHAGGAAPGEIGGLIFRGDNRYPERMACYGDRVGALSLDRPLRASGKVSLLRGVSDSTTLFGFYHSSRSMASGTSQADSLPDPFFGTAVEGPSRDGFYFDIACRVAGNQVWGRHGGAPPIIYPNGTSHSWRIDYDPDGAGGRGRVSLLFDEKKVEVDLPPGFRQSGAEFDRFGFITTWIDGNGQNIYFDDLTYSTGKQ